MQTLPNPRGNGLRGEQVLVEAYHCVERRCDDLAAPWVLLPAAGLYICKPDVRAPGDVASDRGVRFVVSDDPL
jgi:hypothetical protein